MKLRASTEYGKGVQYGFDIFPFWNNLSDRVAYMRMFASGRDQDMRIAQAMISQDPNTPDSEIRRNMTNGSPPKYGYPADELTISQVLSGEFHQQASHINDSAWNDFSDDNSETNAAARPGIFW